MLYVTTRSDRDAFTAHHAMTHDAAPDGGWFIPRQMPCFTEEDLQQMAHRSFCDIVAFVLNLLARGSVTGREVEKAIGSRSARIHDLNSRTMTAELWRDSDDSFPETVRRLLKLMVQEDSEPGQWFTLSVRIAMLCGIYAELMAKGVVSTESPLDLAVPSMDFQLPMAAWYARSWGLPIGTIICACNENNAPWSLLHQGEMRTDTPVLHTVTSACDQALPGGLERLIAAVLGTGEVKKYLAAVKAGGLYELEASQQEALRQGLSVAVISRRRIEFMLPNIYRSRRWTPDPYAVMAYAALADHRARTGETGKALVLAEENPLYSADILAGILNMPADRLRRRLENT